MRTALGKRLMSVFLTLAIVVGMMPTMTLPAYAASGNLTTGFQLCEKVDADNNVIAKWNADKSELIISGKGQIDIFRWIAMGRKIHDRNFRNTNAYGLTDPSYGGFLKTEDFDIRFKADSPKAIILPENSKMMFENFDQQIYFLDDGVSQVDTSSVFGMYAMFYGCKNFNQPVPFDTENVISMNNMFDGCTNFNQRLNFDTRNVKNMRAMFYGCKNFNQPVNFNSEKVTNMYLMFGEATSFNKPVSLKTGNVTQMQGMFSKCTNFNQPVNFDTRNVTSMYNMFKGCTNFNQPVNFNTENVEDMGQMFFKAESFNQPVNFDTRNVTDMHNMFAYTYTFNQPVNFNTENVEDMQKMFSDSHFNQDIKFNSSKAEYANGILWGNTKFNKELSLDLSSSDYVRIGGECRNLQKISLYRAGEPIAFTLTKDSDDSKKYSDIRFSGFKDVKIECFDGEYRIEKNGEYFKSGTDITTVSFEDGADYHIYKKGMTSKKNIIKSTADAIAAVEFTGGAVKPEVHNVRYGGALLTEGVDYEVFGYIHNNRVGKAYVAIDGMGEYVGRKYLPFTISSGVDDFVLSDDGGVKSSYDAEKKILNIVGTGKINRDKWAALAKKFSSDNFADTTYANESSWVSDEEFDIVFKSDTQKSIKLPDNCLYLFANFDNNISFGIKGVDTSEVTDMSYMFYDCENFNSEVDFDTENVIDMAYMFYGCDKFNKTVDFNTANVSDMSSMFAYCKSFNQAVDFDTANVNHMNSMFDSAESFNQEIDFDTHNVWEMNRMFDDAKSFDKALYFDVSSLKSTSSLNKIIEDSKVSDLRLINNGESSALGSAIWSNANLEFLE